MTSMGARRSGVSWEAGKGNSHSPFPPRFYRRYDMVGYKALAMSQEMFCGKMRGEHPGYKIIQNPLPKDAKVTAMKVNSQTGELEFCIYSETYDWIKPGLPIPYAPVPMYVEWEESK
jgi:hypothetical protein